MDTKKRTHEQMVVKSGSQSLKEVWTALFPKIVKIFEKGTELNNEEYMKLYSLVYELCFYEDDEHSPCKSSRSSTARSKAKNHPGSHLYGAIKKYLVERVTYLETLITNKINEKLDDKSKLAFYVNHADIFFKGAKQLNGICQTLNKALTKLEDCDVNVELKPTGSLFHPIIYLSSIIWKSSSLYPVTKTITSCMLRLMMKEREGESVPTETIAAMISSILTLGYEPLKVKELLTYMKSIEIRGLSAAKKEKLRKVHLEEIELSVYREIFETPFLRDVLTFYSTKMSIFANLSPLEYVNLIELWRNDETTRANIFCIHPTTKDKLIKSLVHLWINKNEKVFNGIAEILAQNNPQELLGLENICQFLKRLKNLVIASQDPECLKEFTTEIEKQIAVTISEELKKECKKDKKKAHDTDFYINVFLKWNDSFRTIIPAVLGANQQHFEIVKRGIECALKKNFVTDLLQRPTKSNEHFVLKYHLLLTSTSISEEDKLKQLRTYKNLFEFLPDPYGFSRYYQMLMITRLTDGTFQEKVELAAVNDFEDICKMYFTHRLKQLIKEGTTTSQVILDGFNNSYKNNNNGQSLPFEFKPAVFSNLNWPYSKGVDEDDIAFNICPEVIVNDDLSDIVMVY